MCRTPCLLLTGVLGVALSTPTVRAQSWDPAKVYDAAPGGTPSSLRYIDPDPGTGFLGWTVSDTGGTITNDAPDQRPAVSGLFGNYFRVDTGKEKHRTLNWTLDGGASTRTALFWRIYIPSSPAITEYPSIQIRTHDLRHHLDFMPNVLASGGCAPATAGWVADEQAVILSGGKIIPDGSGERYLPMSMNRWHTIRVEVFANGRYEAWIDEEDGLTDVRHVVCDANKADGTVSYVEIGARSSDNSTQYYTNFLAFGQDTGAVNEIEPLPAGDMEICDNGLDDNDNGLIDCEEPGCLCEIRPELCDNGIDDDADGLVDCADPDCENARHCGDTEPHFALTLVRQIGNWQNVCQGEEPNVYCNSAIYFSVYDEFGNPVNGVTLSDPLNCVQVTTWDPDGAGDQQGGHIRHVPAAGLVPTTYQFYVSQYNGQVVSSDVTPPLHADLPPRYSHSAWQIEFQLVSERWNAGEYTPTEPAYIFDGVELNEPPGYNVTLADDESGLGDVDYGLGGAGVMVGQTFKAKGNRILSARVEATVGFQVVFQYQLAIHELLNNPPSTLADIGPQIGGTIKGPANMFDSAFWDQMIVWPTEGPNSVPATPGETYFLEITRADVPGGELNVFVTTPVESYYDDGMQFRKALGGAFGNDHLNYDVVGYVVDATITPPDPCRVHDPIFDVNDDDKVDSQDYVVFEDCATGPGIPMPPDASLECLCMDRNGDNVMDQKDFGPFQACYSGSLHDADPTCDD